MVTLIGEMMAFVNISSAGKLNSGDSDGGISGTGPAGQRYPHT